MSHQDDHDALAVGLRRQVLRSHGRVVLKQGDFSSDACSGERCELSCVGQNEGLSNATCWASRAVSCLCVTLGAESLSCGQGAEGEAQVDATVVSVDLRFNTFNSSIALVTVTRWLYTRSLHAYIIALPHCGLSFTLLHRHCQALSDRSSASGCIDPISHCCTLQLRQI